MSTFHFSPRANRANQIHWRPWGETAFAHASEHGKPVLLAISAVWCHWCHVMDETSYSDPSIIERINERFIPVRVDNDQRPDVNARYNMGGWPTTAFLTPDGEVLYGGTYIPPEALRQILERVDALYSDADNRRSIQGQVDEMKAARAARTKTPRGGDVDPQTAELVAQGLWSAFDREYGGFGEEQKFPHLSALHFLLDMCARHQQPRAKEMVQRTLHGMADGGMYDRVQGGFYRYSTTRDFSVPHFEKMLEDNAGLLHACARAGAMFDDGGLRRTATDVKRYLDEHLWVPKRAAYGGSQDADEAYYALDAAARSELAEPYVDPIIYTSWNAQAASALLLSAPLLRGEMGEAVQWTARGLSVLETLWKDLLDDGLMCRYFDGLAHVRGLLADQCWAAWAALAAFQVTGHRSWLERARELIHAADALYDAEAEGYVDRLASTQEPGRVREPVVMFEENAIMARALLHFGAVSGEAHFAERARAMLRRHARDYASEGLFAAAYASAVLDVVEPPVDVHIVGPLSADGTRALREAALDMPSPPMRIDSIDPKEAPTRALEFAAGHPDGTSSAALCSGMTCFARVTTADALITALSGLRLRA